MGPSHNNCQAWCEGQEQTGGLALPQRCFVAGLKALGP